MEIARILEELKNRRTQIDTAIRSLELMAVGQKRRGRPPKWIAETNAVTGAQPKRRGRPRKI
jgi:hypothetical protein